MPANIRSRDRARASASKRERTSARALFRLSPPRFRSSPPLSLPLPTVFLFLPVAPTPPRLALFLCSSMCVRTKELLCVPTVYNAAFKIARPFSHATQTLHACALLPLGVLGSTFSVGRAFACYRFSGFGFFEDLRRFRTATVVLDSIFEYSHHRFSFSLDLLRSWEIY